ncbi:hypothetical protein LTR08_004360 [Meristemomyces frigidus]|nr:hypothetical protein LTR08_004360 [Meristemomyces frigidus]
MANPRQPTIGIELPNLSRRNTVATSDTTADTEAQRSPRSSRTPGVRRASTTHSMMSSTIADESSARSKRRDTVLSSGSALSSPTLEREPTWRVEDEALHGYPKLATFLSGTDGYAIYKRFASLNARNLLYHQAKLTRLEHELHEMEMELAHEQELHYRIDHIFHSESGSMGYNLRKKYEEVSLALEKYNRLGVWQRWV